MCPCLRFNADVTSDKLPLHIDEKDVITYIYRKGDQFMHNYYQYPSYINPQNHFRSAYYVPYYLYPTAYYPYYRQLPDVNPSIFMESAHHMQNIMKAARDLLEKMASSRKFSLDLMNAAQKSDQQTVNALIKGTGIQIIPVATYTPDGLKLQFQSPSDSSDCCGLTLTLRWM